MTVLKVTDTNVAEEILKADIALRRIKTSVYSSKHNKEFEQLEKTLLLTREMVHLFSHVNVHSMAEATADYVGCTDHKFGNKS